MNHSEQLEAAFAQASAILALEHMVPPEGHAQLVQDVIDGKLSTDEAIAQVLAEARRAAAAGQ
jgi:hypothetical protein